MLYNLQEALVSLFMQDQSNDVLDVSAANVAMFKITRLPYFQGAYDHHVLMQRSDVFYQLHVEAKQCWVNCDPLSYSYDDGYGDYYDEDEDVDEAPRCNGSVSSIRLPRIRSNKWQKAPLAKSWSAAPKPT